MQEEAGRGPDFGQEEGALAREARKARNHAPMVAGGLIVNHAPCGNWKRIDWDRLAA